MAPGAAGAAGARRALCWHCLVWLGLALPVGGLQRSGASPPLREDAAVAAQAPVRLQVIAVTHTKGASYAALVQEAVKRHMGPSDRFVNICDPGCAQATEGLLENVVEMDDSAFSSGGCLYNGTDCEGYRRAQMKFFFGVRHEVQRLVAADLPLPQWFLVKDDDTYVNVERLVAVLDGLDRMDPLTDPLSLAELSTAEESKISSDKSSLPLPEIVAHGGGGWLLSAELARRLALEEGGERCMQTVQAHLQRDPSAGELNPDLRSSPFGDPGAFCYDVWVPTCVALVNGTMLNSTLLSSDPRAQRSASDFGDRGCPPEGTATFHLEWKRKLLGDEEALRWAAGCLA